MADSVKEVVTTQTSAGVPMQDTSVEKDATGFQTSEYLIYFIFGVLEVLVGFRFFLKLAGANSSSPFVDFIYSLSAIFVMPFEGIFRNGVAETTATTSVFEPAAIVAMIVYAVLAIGIVQLVRVLSRKKQVE